MLLLFHMNTHNKTMDSCHEKTHLNHCSSDDCDDDIVAKWLTCDPKRTIAGALAGITGCALMVGAAMIMCAQTGRDMWYPLKAPALPVLGPVAMELGTHVPHILVGALVWFGLLAVYGALFAQFTYAQKFSSLLMMGFTWGIFGWIFINNLFSASFRDVLVNKPPYLAAFLGYLLYGFGLTSVNFFHKALKGK
jgi:hypothetical protein